MLEKIPLYVAVCRLEDGIKKYRTSQSNLETLINQTSTVSESYYEGHGAIAATNDEMKTILVRMRMCNGALKNLHEGQVNEKIDTKNKELEKMKKAIWRLSNAIEEIDRWTTEGIHWKN
jgi:hypothetical protein